MIFDAQDGAAEKNTIAEVGRHALRDDLRAPFDALVLGPTVVEDHRQQASGRSQIVQDPEQRDALRVPRPDRAADQAKHRRREARRGMLAEPVSESFTVECRSIGHPPGLANRHLLGETIELPGDLAKVDRFGKADVRQETARDPAFDVVGRVAVVVVIKGADPKLGHQGSDAVLTGADPFPTDLHDVPAADGHVERAPTHALPRLEHDERIHPQLLELAPGHQTREPCADDDDVHVSRPGPCVVDCGGSHQTRPGNRRRRGGASGHADKSPAGESIRHGDPHPLPAASQATISSRSSMGTVSTTPCMIASAVPRVPAAASSRRRAR